MLFIKWRQVSVTMNSVEVKEIKNTLLIVEDSSTLRQAYGNEVKQYKPHLCVDTAENGKEAIEKVRAFKDYNAIIMDVNMPIMNGIEAAQEIRKLGYTGTILAYTTLYHEEAKKAMMEGEMDGFILKQLGTGKLIAYLEKYNLI